MPYTPPALNAVDFYLFSYTPPDFFANETTLISYSPPLLNAVDLSLESYTPYDYNNIVNFQLDPTIPAGVLVSIKWNVRQLANTLSAIKYKISQLAFGLFAIKWNDRQLAQTTFAIKWNVRQLASLLVTIKYRIIRTILKLKDIFNAELIDLGITDVELVGGESIAELVDDVSEIEMEAV